MEPWTHENKNNRVYCLLEGASTGSMILLHLYAMFIQKNRRYDWWLIMSYGIHWAASFWYHMDSTALLLLNDLNLINNLMSERLRWSGLTHELWMNISILAMMPVRDVSFSVLYCTFTSLYCSIVIFRKQTPNRHALYWFMSGMAVVNTHLLTYTHEFHTRGVVCFHWALGVFIFYETLTHNHKHDDKVKPSNIHLTTRCLRRLIVALTSMWRAYENYGIISRK
jgi:hypothetical protein